jgi:hypothetical protein
LGSFLVTVRVFYIFPMMSPLTLLVFALALSTVSGRFMDWVNPHCVDWNSCRLAVLNCTETFHDYVRKYKTNLNTCGLFRRCPYGYELHWDPFWSADSAANIAFLGGSGVEACMLSGMDNTYVNDRTAFGNKYNGGGFYATQNPPNYGLAPLVRPFANLVDCLDRNSELTGYLDVKTFDLRTLTINGVMVQGFQIAGWPTSCFQPYFDTYRQVMSRIGAI